MPQATTSTNMKFLELHSLKRLTLLYVLSPLILNYTLPNLSMLITLVPIFMFIQTTIFTELLSAVMLRLKPCVLINNQFVDLMVSTLLLMVVYLWPMTLLKVDSPSLMFKVALNAEDLLTESIWMSLDITSTLQWKDV